MPYIAGLVDGYDMVNFVPSDHIEAAVSSLKSMPYVWFVVFSLHSKMDENVSLEYKIQQKDADLYQENTSLTLRFVDTYHGDEVLKIQGSMSENLEDFASIVSVAHATEQFESFELFGNDNFSDYVSDSEAFNARNTLGRNVYMDSMAEDTDKVALSDDDLFDALVEAEERPNYLAMFFSDNLPLFLVMLRASEKLNIPLKVELDPTLTPDQMVLIAEELSAYSHRVEIIVCAVLARPNNSTSIYGKKVPRYALGTIMGYTLLRNAKTNAQGIPPLKTPVAGYDFPMRWAGMQMRNDVKFNEDVIAKLAEAKINVVRKEVYDTGTRYVLSDCLTQYDSKTSVLSLTSSAEISMFIDNRLINICKRHLLKGKSDFISDALRECQSFLEQCASETAGLLVDSSELGGKYVISITSRQDRPHDAVDLKCGYRPEGAVRAAYLDTSVHK
ncbi:hypothetical protein [Acinetobacter chengduensis]|uniref:Uncharacterized protein n=1 Tax=Acinetobacter chengduensis TaxID=2420890 RepID=A0ABX9TSJ6_9GAMM|nr:hypothetical protein [Acinetobacter chengduensis]RLL18996.1 hypothetical protein D9K81_14660 [Acinetobacter chengduensis]